MTTFWTAHVRCVLSSRPERDQRPASHQCNESLRLNSIDCKTVSASVRRYDACKHHPAASAAKPLQAAAADKRASTQAYMTQSKIVRICSCSISRRRYIRSNPPFQIRMALLIPFYTQGVTSCVVVSMATGSSRLRT